MKQSISFRVVAAMTIVLGLGFATAGMLVYYLSDEDFGGKLVVLAAIPCAIAAFYLALWPDQKQEIPLNIPKKVHTFTTWARLAYPPEFLVLTIAIQLYEKEHTDQNIWQIELDVKAAIAQTAASIKMSTDPHKIFGLVFSDAQAAAQESAHKLRLSFVDLKIVNYDVERNKPENL